MYRPDGFHIEDDFDDGYDYDLDNDFLGSDAESGYDEPSNPAGSTEADLSHTLHDAMKFGLLPQVEELVAIIENYDTFLLSNSWRPLSFAAYLGKPELVEYFINYESERDVKSSKNGTPAPLTLACSVLNENVGEDHLRCVELLLDAGADINARDRYGVTALMTACKSSTLEIVEFLLAKGATVNTADNDGWSALFYAVNRGDFDVIQVVLKYGADISKIDKRDRYAYAIATDKGFTEVAEVIKPEAIAASERAAFDCMSLRVRPLENSILDDAQPNYYDEVLDMVATSATDMGRYVNVFSANKVTLRQLLLVRTEEELKKIGVIFSWHRRTLIERIQLFHLGCWSPKSLGLLDKKDENQPCRLMMAFTFVATLHRQIYVLRTTIQYLNDAVSKFPDYGPSLIKLKEMKTYLNHLKARLRSLKHYTSMVSCKSRHYLLAQEITT